MIRGRALLALTAELSRTGAPALLASLLSELERDGAIDAERTRVLALRGGPLAEDLSAVGSVRVLGPTTELTGEAARRLLAGRRGWGDRVGVAMGVLRQPARPAHGPPDLVWANGAAALRLAAALPRPARRAPLVAHVHEMEVGLRRSLAGEDPRTLLERAGVVVAVSRAVADHLVGDIGLDPARVVVHHGWVPHLDHRGPPRVERLRPEGVPADALVVGGCGAVGWRKGTDLFLELARRLPTTLDGRPLHLVWVGGEARPGDLDRTRRDAALRGVAERVHLVGEVADAAPWIDSFDVFALTSREDPFPLVVLEAGSRGIPVLGFRSGGVAEAVPDDDHDVCLCDPFDLDGLAERTRVLLADADARRAVGSALATRVRTRHQAGPRVAALWADVAARLARA